MIKPSFRALEALLPIMGAERIKWESDGITRQRAEFIRNLTTTGIEVEYKDIVIRDDGLLEANGEQIVIYIKNHGGNNAWNGFKRIFSGRELNLNLHPMNLRRVHLGDCGTINRMKYNNLYNDRYVATARKDGLYEIDLRGREIETELYPCINCIKRLNYKNYRNCDYIEQREVIQNFDINDFFKLHETKFKSKPKMRE